MVDLGLVKKTPEGLRPTLFGHTALRRYDELTQTAPLGQVLAGLGPDAIDPIVFVGSEFVAPETDAIDKHLARAQDLLESATTVRGVVPAASSDNEKLVRVRVEASQLRAEFVLGTELYADLDRENMGELAEVLDCGLSLWKTTADVPFGFYVAEGPESVQMAIEFRDEALMTGILVNDTAESIHWAETLFSHYKDDASKI
ncbi:hypothetical protein GJR96_16780 [Haloferax sp. MBLA0076]|uniref:Methanogenesis regulatory protein FilR1 middle domain-containing protein n=1 Tax=Haloferax litoreum TaxID=2666140 RepID=A0A6A8GLC0_9EURY|nr:MULTISPECIES: hypothetical protein [Haloferax]KAB1190609.1 hypothetical protein Hfx1148_16725 [Haloferax sp. CBA1148]MRX23601.1 hypothetical protein [Haloferax litoreum]